MNNGKKILVLVFVSVVASSYLYAMSGVSVSADMPVSIFDSASKAKEDKKAPMTIALPKGGTYTAAQTVKLKCRDNTGGSGCGKTYYTTDGTAPTASSTVYSSPITISLTTVLKFFSVDKAGNQESPRTETYKISSEGAGSSLDDIIANLESRRPSWNTLNSYASALSLSYPAFRKGLTLLPGYFSRGTLSQYMNMWSTIESSHSVNITSAFFGVMPPTGYTWPYSSSVLDEKLRAFSAIAVKKKQKGLAVVLVNQPSDTGLPLFSSASEFQSWVTNTHLPMVKQEAQAAERMKIEYYGPFPKEVEVFLGSGYQPTLWNNLACADILDAAQWWVNQARDTAKKYYTGKLIAHSYGNYDFGKQTCWQGISYTGYDEILFTIVPTCSLTDTASYLDAQLDGYLTIVANSSNIPWSIGEVWVKETYFKACGNSLAPIEADIYSMVFVKVHSRTSQPIGMGIDYNSSDDATSIGSAAMSIVDSYFNSH